MGNDQFIVELRKAAAHRRSSPALRLISDMMKQAADVLEASEAENQRLRDQVKAAAVQVNQALCDIPHDCSTCWTQNSKYLPNGSMTPLCLECTGNRRCNWLWRGAR